MRTIERSAARPYCAVIQLAVSRGESLRACAAANGSAIAEAEKMLIGIAAEKG